MQAGELIPNQAVLINSIPLLEAQASSEIENIVTTTDRLFQYADDRSGSADPATKEALRYRTALRQGLVSLATAADHPHCRQGLPNHQGHGHRHSQYAGYDLDERCDR